MLRENAISPWQTGRATRSVISIADASDRPRAHGLNPSIVRGLCCSHTVRRSVGVELGCGGRNSLWICVGLKAFLLSQPNVTVRM